MIVTRNEWAYLLTLLWSSTIWKLLQRLFNNAPAHRIAIAMNRNSVFTGSYTQKSFWYQQFDPRQMRLLRRGQPIVDFDAAGNCRRYVTTVKAMNFQDDMP